MECLEFQRYRLRHRAVIRAILSRAQKGSLDEAAFPAYSHRNPLIHWLFWERLAVVMRYLEAQGRFETVLDFGTGSGVMLPFLAERAGKVLAYDVDLMPLERVAAEIPLPKNVETLDAKTHPLSSLAPRSIDLVVALDVLEHLEDLERGLTEILACLRPGGLLVASCPTENALYRLGRRIAGADFSGDYHERGSKEIREALSKLAPVETLKVLIRPVPLFEIFVAKA
ncbi:MAG: class I SAM-dependent methyltransferase [Myxococcota bacterium]